MAAQVSILKFGVSSPADTSPLKHVKVAGYNASKILAVIGKSEGNGCVNDFSRTLSTVVWEPLIPDSAVTIFSEGTEGVLSPHVTFIVREEEATGLLAAAGRTRVLEPHEIGTAEHATQIASSVREILERTNISRENVNLVLIKCPLLTSEKVGITKAASKAPVTEDTYESMAKSRYASAVGIAVALGEIGESYLDEAMRNETTWSSRASCSSGAELEDCHILIIASDPSSGNLRGISAHMDDAIDANVILRVLDQVKTEKGRVLQVFAKAEASKNGTIRGMRHTMNNDSDIHSTRHARAAMGGLIAGLVGDTQLYISGGAEGQGPPGGGSLAVFYTVAEPHSQKALV
ncbi:Cyanuric acid amidohydrolase [Lachnellula suecica]|uniref:Cyanuric acid amidohydrolase n=1 Tax=Lachnellula suecica TaxID=602035 RepID=A0A8T9CFR1_9HELO|nr:Cyanuric acid amidohydrolase [Lachnellula suecica]